MPRRTLAVIGRIDPLQFIVQDAIGAVRIYDSHHIKLFPGLLDISNVGQWRYRMMSMRLICVTGATEFMLGSAIPYWRDLTWGLRDRRGMPPDCVAGSALIQRLRRVFHPGSRANYPVRLEPGIDRPNRVAMPFRPVRRPLRLVSARSRRLGRISIQSPFGVRSTFLQDAFGI
jgi:hypothetical protein